MTIKRVARLWASIPEEDQATEQEIREFYSLFLYNPVIRAERRITLLKSPQCRVGLPLDFIRKKGRPYVLCANTTKYSGKFCRGHNVFATDMGFQRARPLAKGKKTP